MSIQLAGTIAYRAMGTGAWALVTSTGETYELYHPPSQLQVEGLEVIVQGQVRRDVMTLAMIGPVLEVEQFQPRS